MNVNAPNDDAIVLKSSFALGEPRATENVTITNSIVSGFDVGTVLDGTYGRTTTAAPDRDGPTGRIKFGTESNGGFRNITISNVVFHRSRGLALETVDGGLLEDVTISNITMREVSNAPIFLRLASRMRGPAGTPVGKLRRVSISNVTVYDADPRYPVDDRRHPEQSGRGRPPQQHPHLTRAAGSRSRRPRSSRRTSSTTSSVLPAGIRRAIRTPCPSARRCIRSPACSACSPRTASTCATRSTSAWTAWRSGFTSADTRPAFVFDDVRGIDLHGVRAQTAPNVPTFVLRDVEELRVTHSAPLRDTYVKRAARQSF